MGCPGSGDCFSVFQILLGIHLDAFVSLMVLPGLVIVASDFSGFAVLSRVRPAVPVLLLCWVEMVTLLPGLAAVSLDC